MARAPRSAAERQVQKVVDQATKNMPSSLNVPAISPADAQAGAAARVIGIVLSALITLIGFMQTRDLAGLIVYIQDAEFLSAISAVVMVALFVWSQLKTRSKQKQLLYASDTSPVVNVVPK